MHNCDSDDARQVGPVKRESAISQSKDVFYFAHGQRLRSTRYEFHKNKKLGSADVSFVYLLRELNHIRLQDILDYLESDLRVDGSLGLMNSAADSIRDL